MPTRITIGVSRRLGVTFSSPRIAVVMKPECSATPMPSIATSTTPTGPKVMKRVTISAMKVTKLSPAS